MRGKGSERAKNERLRTELKQANRELRIFRAREQDASERGAGPADVEGVGGRPSILVYRDKNYLEFKRALDRAPAIPRLPLKRGDPDGERVGFQRGVYYLQNELGRLLDAIILSPAVTPTMVRDRHRMRMYLHTRAGAMLRPDVVGRTQRAGFLNIVERVAFASSIPTIFTQSSETETIPSEAPRKGFSGGT